MKINYRIKWEESEAENAKLRAEIINLKTKIQIARKILEGEKGEENER
ncbi:MAG: hypothetical protein ACHQYP_05945 [Nitrospiria bacterium]